MKIQVNKPWLKLETGDITECSADVIVNAENSVLIRGAGIIAGGQSA
ncbi:MAG: hypothetical protein VB778_00875 [Nitrospinaceae bacterium]|jgi:O-acetyl-ADP-ribose deacetylase (regulator of RNase III)